MSSDPMFPGSFINEALPTRLNNVNLAASRLDQAAAGKGEKKSAPKSADKTKTSLPDDFEPSDHSVICGNKRQFFNSKGNRRFRVTCQKYVTEFTNALTKNDKSMVVTKVLDQIRSDCPVGAFVSFENGKWWEVSERAAREKIGTFFRDCAGETYRSSAKNKIAQRRTKRKIQKRSSAGSSAGNLSSLDEGSSSHHSSWLSTATAASAPPSLQYQTSMMSVATTASAPPLLQSHHFSQQPQLEETTSSFPTQMQHSFAELSQEVASRMEYLQSQQRQFQQQLQIPTGVNLGAMPNLSSQQAGVPSGMEYLQQLQATQHVQQQQQQPQIPTEIQSSASFPTNLSVDVMEMERLAAQDLLEGDDLSEGSLSSNASFYAVDDLEKVSLDEL